MKITYLLVAEQAVIAEINGHYQQAAILWNKAARASTSPKNQLWAEYRAGHNILRNSLEERYYDWRAKRKQRVAELELKKEIALLAQNVNKES